MSRFIACALSFAALVGAAIPQLPNSPIMSGLEPVTDLQISELTGRWFEVYTTSLLMHFMDNSRCAVLDVVKSDNTGSIPGATSEVNIDSFDVKLYFNRDQNTGDQKQMTFKVLGEVQGDGLFKLLLNETNMSQVGDSLQNRADNRGPLMDRFMMDLTFSVIAVGDLDTPATPGSGASGTDIVPADQSQQQYPWIMLAGPLGFNFIVLARDPDQFESQWKSVVMSRLTEKGAFILPPQKIFQSKTECNYPAVGSDIAGTGSGTTGGATPGILPPVPEQPAGLRGGGGR